MTFNFSAAQIYYIPILDFIGKIQNPLGYLPIFKSSPLLPPKDLVCYMIFFTQKETDGSVFVFVF